MCRAHNIPVIVMSSDVISHSWNLVYINGRQMEIDFTHYIKFGVYGKGTNIKTPMTLPSGSDTGRLFGVIPHSYSELPKDVFFDKQTYMENFDVAA